MKIASLEDDLDQARRIQQVLTAAGYTCSSYEQSRDLLSAMRNESFDLVLLDWHLPDIDGDDVVRWLRANIGPRIPVIFLTNRSSEDDLVEGLRAGADDYIVKPLRPWNCWPGWPPCCAAARSPNPRTNRSTWRTTASSPPPAPSR